MHLKKIILCLTFLLTVLLTSAQESVKLARDFGFKDFKIGVGFDDIKSLLDTNNARIYSNDQKMYFLSSSAKGYESFEELRIDRLEAYFSSSEILNTIRIYIDKQPDNVKVIENLLDIYGSARLWVKDYLEVGEHSLYWYSDSVTMYLTTAFGTYDGVNNKYIEIIFSKTLGAK